MKKDIVGFDGRYTIDDQGNIYSNDKVMRPYKINSGYLAIKLQYHGKRFHYLVHRLVAEYFLEGAGDVVDHIDGNRLNNKVSNLRYCSQKENLHYHGYDYNSGCKHYKSYLTEDEIMEIRRKHEEEHIPSSEIYRMYSWIPKNTLYQILYYKTHKKIPC